MKTNKLLIPVVLSIIGVVSAVSGFSQTRSRVGVNLVLKPLQTIHIEGNSVQPNSDQPNRQNHRVATFGTTAYQLVVDSVTVNASHIAEKILSRYISAEMYRAVAYSRIQNKEDVRLLPRTLIMYSIQVR